MCNCFQISLRKEYPQPPAAHSRTQHPSAKHPHMPDPKSMKIEPGFNALGYPAYQPAGLLTTVDKKVKSELPNPPPLLSEPKPSSVIVKNEAKREQQQAPPMPGAKYSYPMRTSAPQPNLPPKQQQQQQQQQHHMSQADARAVLYPTGTPFATAGKGSAVAYPYSTAPPHNPKLYGPPGSAPPPQQQQALNKPKVSSPAPPHIYGMPTQVLGPPTVSTHHHRSTEAPSQMPSVPHHMSNKSYLAPPPAHTSSRHLDHSRVLDHARMFPQGTPSPSPGATPAALRASPLPVMQTQQRPPQPSSAPVASPAICQMQPLDLGCRDSGSPNKRSAPSPDPSKKRRVETPQPSLAPHHQHQQQQQPPPTMATPPPSASPQLSRVSEPSPLIASAATTITTVENKVVCAGGVLQRPPSNPPTPSSGNTTPSKPPSPAPKSYPGLKKAWLQRHTTGETGEYFYICFLKLNRMES
jgi:[histone H3]-dimethyl-L-lysine9 demethylase